MPIIYIAGPLLEGHTLTFEQGKEHWKNTVGIAEKIMQKGWTVYIPHHSLYMWQYIKEENGRDIPWQEWMVQDSGFIQVAQAIYFIGHSKGADRELAYALDNDKKVYMNVDDVPKVTPEDCLIRADTPTPEPYKVEPTEGNIQ
jgi:hypothetical protein